MRTITFCCEKSLFIRQVNNENEIISPEGEQQIDVPKDMSRIGVGGTRSHSDRLFILWRLFSKIILWNYFMESFDDIIL